MDPIALKSLKKALETEDAGTIDLIINELYERACNADVKAEMIKISEHVLLSDYEEPIRIVDQLLRGS